MYLNASLRNRFQKYTLGALLLSSQRLVRGGCQCRYVNLLDYNGLGAVF